MARVMGKSHTLIALTGAVVIASQATSDYTQAGVLIGASVATAKLPDIDIKLGIRHRGPATHSLLAAVLFALCVGVAVDAWAGDQWAPLAMAGVALGVVLHVLADGLTISGVPLAWPIVRRDVHLLPRGFRVRTDGAVESVLAFVLLAGLLGFVWMTYGG